MQKKMKTQVLCKPLNAMLNPSNPKAILLAIQLCFLRRRLQ